MDKLLRRSSQQSETTGQLGNAEERRGYDQR